jgi:hypothetical protein
MRIARAAGLSVLCVAGTTLGGCATSMAIEPAAGVSLAGAWKLDPAASDDPQKILDHMREEAYKIISRGPATTYARPGARRGNTQDQASQSNDQDYLLAPGPGGQRPDPLQRSPMAHTIMTSAERGEFLTIRQGPGEFVLDYGNTRRSFTPGGHSVVSAEGGVGDQTSGWSGRSYTIVVKEQYGSTVTEEYSLSPDGGQLVEKLHISSAELSGVTLTRVYLPTHESAPRVTPNTD